MERFAMFRLTVFVSLLCIVGPVAAITREEAWPPVASAQAGLAACLEANKRNDSYSDLLDTCASCVYDAAADLEVGRNYSCVEIKNVICAGYEKCPSECLIQGPCPRATEKAFLATEYFRDEYWHCSNACTAELLDNLAVEVPSKIATDDDPSSKPGSANGGGLNGGSSASRGYDCLSLFWNALFVCMALLI
jgi:hypothetical protein